MRGWARIQKLADTIELVEEVIGGIESIIIINEESHKEIYFCPSKKEIVFFKLHCSKRKW